MRRFVGLIFTFLLGAVLFSGQVRPLEVQQLNQDTSSYYEVEVPPFGEPDPKESEPETGDEFYEKFSVKYNFQSQAVKKIIPIQIIYSKVSLDIETPPPKQFV